jgi:pilus assembly protein CpaF
VIDDLLRERVRHRLLAGAEPIERGSVIAALHAEGCVLGDADVTALLDLLHNDTRLLGPLTPLLEDECVTDIVVNAPDDVRIDRGDGLMPSGVRFADDAAVRRLAQRLAAQAGRRLDDAAPWVDARLTGGVRLHAVLPPISTAGTLISLRIPPPRPLTMADLVRRGSINERGVGWLQRLIAARRTFVVIGGTGSGKTTVLTSLLGLVPASERIVILEDAPELRPDHPHWVSLGARPSNAEGTGGVALRDLVRQSLRMRPDRIVVGEVRGDEIVDLVLAFNTGHRGGATTLHADSAADVPTRLQALALAAGMHPAAVDRQLAAAIDAVLEVRRVGGRRFIAGIHALVRDGDCLTVLPAVEFHDAHSHAEPITHPIAESLLPHVVS